MYSRSALLLFAAGILGCGSDREPTSPPPVLRVAIDSEPSTWNRLLATDWATHLVTDQLHAPLVRIDPETQTPEPILAESWKFVEDRLVFHLRKGVRFSDGAPFTARDVVFTFRVLQDESVSSQLSSTILIDGQPIVCEMLDEHTVSFTLPRRTASVVRIFDSIGVLPAHKLERSLEAGTLPSDTGTGAPAEEIVGLGPFRLRGYSPGQRIVLERNPHYFRAAEGLPKLDAIVFELMEDKGTSLLRLENGELDLVDLIDPRSFESLSRDAPDGVVLLDAGPGMMVERLWFNLNPRSPISEHKRAWFRDVRFRRAISLAIDREGLTRVVFRGLASPATGPVSPANQFWMSPSVPPFAHDVKKARLLLEEAGFRQTQGGELVDGAGRPVSFTLLTRSDDTHRTIGEFLQQELTRLGIEMRVAQPGSSFATRVTSTYDYEAALLSIGTTDPDPSAEMAFWMSGSHLHFWHPSQEHPATEWEARIDALMRNQLSALDPGDRKEMFGEVQHIAREQMPMIELAVPHVLLATRSHVRHLRPTPFTHALWNAEAIAIVGAGGNSTRRQVRDLRH